MMLKNDSVVCRMDWGHGKPVLPGGNVNHVGKATEEKGRLGTSGM